MAAKPAVLLGLYLALRVDEIARARWDGFDRDLSWYRVRGAKGGAIATLPVHPLLAEELEDRMTAWVWLFPGSAGRAHVTTATVSGWVSEASHAAGIGHVQTHRLRHTALTTANDETGDLRAVQTFARHAEPATTACYTRTTNDRLRGVVSSLDYS